MKELIDKAAVVAEIEKIIADENESIKTFEHSKNISEVQRSNARLGVLMYIRSFLDTLEVKEVDFEKEIDKWIDDAAITHEDCSVTDVISTAKHFFELGIKAQKGE